MPTSSNKRATANGKTRSKSSEALREFFADRQTQKAFDRCKHNPVRRHDPVRRKGRTSAPNPAPSLKKDAKRHTVSVDRKKLNRDLDDDHFEKVIGSGLNAETINAAQLYSEHDSGKLRGLLNGIPTNAPALILPLFNREGVRIDYAVARPTTSHEFPGGSQAKYLAPASIGSRAYFPPLKMFRKAVNKPGELLLITEGILKSLAATQAGVPCIGLMGVWNWQIKQDDKSAERDLIEDLAGIDWQNRRVAIAFDFDTKRNPNVHHAEAELARVLAEQGANVVILKLPPGEIDSKTGMPEKTGLDDFIAREGEERFREWCRRGHAGGTPHRHRTDRPAQSVVLERRRARGEV